jgi:hypothetical protein
MLQDEQTEGKRSSFHEKVKAENLPHKKTYLDWKIFESEANWPNDFQPLSCV